MREELCLVLESREKKLTFAIIEGGKMDFFFERSQFLYMTAQVLLHSAFKIARSGPAC